MGIGACSSDVGSSDLTSLHALLPHRAVLHVHGVNSIAWAVIAGGETGIAERLAGLDWAYPAYCRPGVPLSPALSALIRSDERRVGQECVRQCRSRGPPDN